MKTQKSWRRTVNQLAPLVTTVAGIVIIISVVVLMDRGMQAVVAAGAGILLLEVGIWYAANPVFTNERRYKTLRAELDRFIECVRELNKTAGVQGAEGRFASIKAAMHESVDAMVGMTTSAEAEAEAEKAAASQAPVQQPAGSSAD
jgi:hypothetical protein